MTLLDEVLQANQAYLEHTQEVNTWSKYPQKHLAIVSCMDTRLVELLEPALGIRRGEVKMIKTAGNTITSKFDDVIRSLLVCIYQFDIKEIMVILSIAFPSIPRFIIVLINSFEVAVAIPQP